MTQFDRKNTTDGPTHTEAVTFLKPKLSIGRFKRQSKVPGDSDSKQSNTSDPLEPPVHKAKRIESTAPPMQTGQTEAGFRPEGQQSHRSRPLKHLWRRHSSRPSIHTHEDYVGPNYFDRHWGLDGSESMQFVTAEKSARLCRNSRRMSARAEIIDPFMKAPHDQEGSLLGASSFFALAVEEELFS